MRQYRKRQGEEVKEEARRGSTRRGRGRQYRKRQGESVQEEAR